MRSVNAAAVSAVFLIVFQNILITFENIISLSARTLIMSAHTSIAYGDAINLSVDSLILSAHALFVSAHPLIVFENTIRLSARTFIVSVLPSDTTCSPTVPGGDTPCVTAGDAQRANPWERDTQTSDAGSVAQHPLYPSQEFIFSLSRRHVVTL